MSLDFIVIIPARYASTRFPAKSLADIAGKPMIVRVAEAAKQSAASQVIVATDDQRIADVLSLHQIDYAMTSQDHSTGTDRLAEVVDILDLDDEKIVVNVQGDEPLIAPGLINAVADELSKKPECSLSTAAYRMTSWESLFNPNVVKVVLDRESRALYFSRAAIPWARDHYTQEQDIPISCKDLPKDAIILHHIGIYGYRAGFLKKYPKLEQSMLEKIEFLEQLRALWHGYKIAVYVTDSKPNPGVDQPEDLEQVIACWQQQNTIHS